jgi:hypothetical protein
VRERDRQTYTVVWVVVTAVLALILLAFGSPMWALALVAVFGTGLVGFLRVTHPGGRGKPNLNIFFDDTGAPVPPVAPAPGHTRPSRYTAPPPRSGAEVIDLRQRDRVPVPTVDEAVAASQAASVPTARPEVTDDLAEHHVRLLRQVQVKLRDYE